MDAACVGPAVDEGVEVFCIAVSVALEALVDGIGVLITATGCAKDVCGAVVGAIGPDADLLRVTFFAVVANFVGAEGAVCTAVAMVRLLASHAVREVEVAVF